MNILVLSPNVPYPLSSGGVIRSYHIIRQLSYQHTIHLLAYRGEAPVADPSGLEAFCKTITILPWKTDSKRQEQARSLFSARSFQWRRHCRREMQDALDKAIRENDIDLVLVEFAQMAGFQFPDDIRVVLDEHNVEFYLLERMSHYGSTLRRAYNRLEAFKFKREELSAAKRSDLTLVTSEHDGETLRHLVPDLRTTCIANGVDTDYFARPEGISRTPYHAVFVGATQYYPNEDGIVYFLRDIFPLVCAECPAFRLSIVGGNPPDSLWAYNSETVTVTGFVDDVRPYMWDASVFIVPLRMGSGTRLKVVEAMAAGAPVVSTTIGAEGITATDGKDLLLADTPDAFAGSVVKVMSNRQLADSLVRNGLALVRRDFDWSAIGRTLNNALAVGNEPASAGTRKIR